jgi:hypothetical protein
LIFQEEMKLKQLAENPPANSYFKEDVKEAKRKQFSSTGTLFGSKHDSTKIERNNAVRFQQSPRFDE